MSLPHRLATKLEARYGRSPGDYLGSHDMEDLLAVIDGRRSIVADCFKTPVAVTDYLREQFARLLSDGGLSTSPGFVEQSHAGERAAALNGRMQDLMKALHSRRLSVKVTCRSKSRR